MWLFNSFITHKKITNKRKQTYVDYRINVAEAILKHIQLPDYITRGKSSQIVTPLRLQAKY